MIDRGETFSEANIKANPDLAKVYYGRQRFQRWEGYINVEADSILKFNLRRATGINNGNMPGTALSINDVPVLSMESEPVRVKKGQTPPAATQSVLVSLEEGFHKITVDFAVESTRQSIDVTYGQPNSADVKITPKTMYHEFHEKGL